MVIWILRWTIDPFTQKCWTLEWFLFMSMKLYISFVCSNSKEPSHWEFFLRTSNTRMFLVEKYEKKMLTLFLEVWKVLYMGLDARKPVFGGLWTTKAQTDQRLCYSLCEKYRMYTCYRWNFNLLASLCSWVAWFETHFLGNPKTGFLTTRPI